MPNRNLPSMRSFLILTILLNLTVVRSLASDEVFEGKPYGDRDVYADTWVATDGLGREVPDFEEAGPIKADKWVGIFYWTWHIPNRNGPYDNTKLLAKAEDGIVPWPDPASHHWGEPELGYYIMTDPFVIRRHANWLVDAGVDVVLFDTTNPPFTWREEYEALCREYEAMRREGARTPAIGFIAPFGDPRAVTSRLWSDLYQPGLWQDLWFQWEGKPLLLANKEFIEDPEILEFFTFRRPMPDYWLGPSGPDQWSWLEVHPQHVYKNSRGEVEQMSVGVAQNALPNTPGPAPMSHKAGAMGRSWHDGAKDERPNATALGLNFEEQWTRAIEVDPKFIFVTGWNEWIAGRYTEWHIYTDEDCYYPGGLFVDQYNHEYSRDCEPMRGGHGDAYYYQLASWIRRFKGIRERPAAQEPHTIRIDGHFEDWIDVSPEFRDTIGDTTHRDHTGYGDLHYRNTTGRNDFVISKAAYDSEKIFFYAQTHDSITTPGGANWMMLFIDADQDVGSGWRGYDFAVNLDVPGSTRTMVSAWGDGEWLRIGEADYRVNGNGMELGIASELIGQAARVPAFDFHWADNVPIGKDAPPFGVDGDNAPNRRWNYRFIVRVDEDGIDKPVGELGELILRKPLR